MIVTNFANGDVIGHTANRDAKIKCAEFVDKYLGTVVEAAINAVYVICITADHGNLEVMTTEEGTPHVSHTTNPVPFILMDPRADTPIKLNDGKLSDIAPTLLQVLAVQQPAVMDGKSLAPEHNFGLQRRALLVILDGWGISNTPEDDPISIAETPVWDNLLKFLSALQTPGIWRCGWIKIRKSRKF